MGCVTPPAMGTAPLHRYCHQLSGLALPPPSPTPCSVQSGLGTHPCPHRSPVGGRWIPWSLAQVGSWMWQDTTIRGPVGLTLLF